MPVDNSTWDEIMKLAPKPPAERQKWPRVTAFMPVHEGHLIALVEATWADGRQEREIRFYQGGTRRWVTPAIRVVSKNRDYWLSTFVCPEAQQRYQELVIAVIDAYLRGDEHVG
jgi:hypothetical protein